MDVTKNNFNGKVNEVREKDYEGLIEKFEKDLKKLNVDKKYFYRNVNDLKINKLKRIKYGTLAEYGLYTNEINICKNYDVTMMHELLHMSSTYYNKDTDIVYSGFSQTNIVEHEVIGIGLNEGITAIIDEKYFSKEKAGYPNLLSKYMSDLISVAFGEDHIMDLYFKADLYTLYKEMASVIGKKRAYKMLESIDYVYYYGDLPLVPNAKITLYHYKRFMYYFIALCYKNIITAFYNNEISEETFDLKMEALEVTACRNIYVTKFKKYIIFDEAELNKLFNKIENKVLEKVIKHEEKL